MGTPQSKESRLGHEKRCAEARPSSQSSYVYVDDSDTREPVEDCSVIEKDGVGVDRRADISVSLMEEWQSKVLSDPKNRLAATAFAAVDPKYILTSRPTIATDQQIYNVTIPVEGSPITNQQASGRCWLFASTNVFRVALMSHYNLSSFELSQAYLFFWDKLEKCNWFLEQIIDTAEKPLNGRLVQTLVQGPISDGGQWDMVYNLVSKYGLVPHTVYPDDFSASHSRFVNSVVVSKLREFALELRRLAVSANAAKLASAKDKMMAEIHRILTVALGPPPSPTGEFTWVYSDKDGIAHTVKTTPHAFAKNIGYPVTSGLRALGPKPQGLGAYLSEAGISSLVSLVHDPRHEPLTLLTVDRLGNVVGGRGITYINVTMETLKKACIRMLSAGLPVFFGSDVGKFSDSRSGVMDLNLIDYELGFGTGLIKKTGESGTKRKGLSAGMNKAQRLRTGQSQMTHAMVLTAVHLDEDGETAIRWRVQNSWGTDAGDHGWFVMSDDWMDEFVFQAVVHPAFIDDEVKKVLEQDPIVLPLWDPMGSLA